MHGPDLLGSSVLRIVMEESLKEKTIATLKMMGIVPLLIFDIFDVSLSHAPESESRGKKTLSNLRIACYMLAKKVKKAHNRWATKGYQDISQLVLVEILLMRQRKKGKLAQGRKKRILVGGTEHGHK